MPTHFPDPDSARLTIGELARAAAVHVETIRFYQRRCLLAQPLRPLGGIRRYGRSDLDRLTFIKSAQRLGFSLEEVRGLLRLDDGAHCREARTLGAAKLALVRGRLELANSYAHYLEITAAGVDKGTALAELCHLLGIDAGEVLAVGDGENDLPMLRFAGMGVAVGNASPAVRQAAPRRASAPFGRGVVEAVAMAEAM